MQNIFVIVKFFELSINESMCRPVELFKFRSSKTEADANPIFQTVSASNNADFAKYMFSSSTC